MDELKKLLDDFEYAVIARCQGYGTSLRLRECRNAILAAHEAKKQQQEHLTSDAVVCAATVPASGEASCLCCGKVGEPKAWKIDQPSTYVCVGCHRRATFSTPEYSTEAEGDAYTHGWFDGNAAEPYGVRVDAPSPCEWCDAPPGTEHNSRCPVKARGIDGVRASDEIKENDRV